MSKKRSRQARKPEDEADETPLVPVPQGGNEPEPAPLPLDFDIEDLPEDPRELIALFAKLEQRSHRGPLPAPWTLEQYKEIDPRALNWVFNSATKEQDNRHWCDKEPLRQSGRAQIFAFVIAVLVILVGAGLIYLDKAAEGLATILVPLATILGVFVYKEVKNRGGTQKKPNGEDREEAA